MKFIVPVIVLIAACGDNVHAECDGVLSVYMFGEPVLAMVKTRGVWAPLQRESETLPFQACVDDEYTVVGVCNDSLGISVNQAFGFVSDRQEVYFGSCESSSGDPSDFVSVTGHMKQPGTVYVGGSGDRSALPNWDFSVAVRPGRHALTASDDVGDGNGAYRVAIRREVELDNATAIEDVDLDAEGIETVEFDLGAILLADESVFTSTDLQIDGTLHQISTSSSSSVRCVGQLEHGERQIVQAVAEAMPDPQRFSFRAIINSFEDIPAEKLELLPRIDDAQGFSADGRSAVIDPPAFNFNYANVVSVGPNSLYLTATKGWMDSNGYSIRPDLSPPGFDPSWLEGRIDIVSLELVAEDKYLTRATATREQRSQSLRPAKPRFGYPRYVGFRNMPR